MALILLFGNEIKAGSGIFPFGQTRVGICAPVDGGGAVNDAGFVRDKVNGIINFQYRGGRHNSQQIAAADVRGAGALDGYDRILILDVNRQVEVVVVETSQLLHLHIFHIGVEGVVGPHKDGAAAVIVIEEGCAEDAGKLQIGLAIDVHRIVMQPFPGGVLRAFLTLRRYDIALHCAAIDIDGVIAGLPQPCMAGYDIQLETSAAGAIDIEARIAIFHLVDIIIDQPAPAAIPEVDGIAADIHRPVLQYAVIIAAVQAHIVIAAIDVQIVDAACLCAAIHGQGASSRPQHFHGAVRPCILAYDEHLPGYLDTGVIGRSVFFLYLARCFPRQCPGGCPPEQCGYEG